MRKSFVLAILAVATMLASCDSIKQIVSIQNPEPTKTQNTRVVTINRPTTATTTLLKSTGTNGVVSFTFFDIDSKKLTREETRQLDELAKEIKAMGKCQVSVIGHSDNIGSSDVNDAVSVKRARLVGDYLKKKGVTNITTSGESYYHPVAGNDTATGRAKNRRVEIFVSTIGKYNPYK